MNTIFDTIIGVEPRKIDACTKSINFAVVEVQYFSILSDEKKR